MKEVKMGSTNLSFKDWDLLKFLQGRKRMIVTLVGGGLAYFITDSAAVATISAAIVEGIFAIVEYYFKKYD